MLVECDLRRPTLAEYLRIEQAVGLTTVLVGRVAVEEALQSWGPDNLRVLTSGVIPPNPADVLQSQAMADLLAALRERYEMVLLDTAPLLPVTDAAVVTAQADGAILVVRHGKTTRTDLEQAVQRVAAVGGRVLGTVLNMAPDKRADGYGSRYGYPPMQGHQGRDSGQSRAKTASRSAIRVTARSRLTAAAAWWAGDRR